MEPMPRDWGKGAASHSPNQSQQQQPPQFRMCRDTHPTGVPHTGSHDSYVMPQTLAGNVSMSESLALPPSSSPATIPNAEIHPAQDPPWSQRVLDGMNDMLLLLTRDGRVLYASPSSVDVAGCKPSQLQGSPLSHFIHDDDRAMFARELEHCIAESRPFYCYFRFHRADNKPCVVEGRGHPHLSQPVDSRSQPETCNGVFIICRPYLTRSTQLLDAFLEHKIENIRLHQRIAQLKQEEEHDLRMAQQQHQQQLWSSANDSQPSAQLPAPQPYPRRRSLRHSSHEAAGSNSNEEAESSDTQASADDDDDDDDENNDLGDADQRTLLSQAAARKQHADNMAHIDGVEVMTGLHYRNGEWSQSLSTGLHNGRFLQGDLDPDRRKRSKGEYMCTDCGTSDSPEWRKGPEGPKTLCNACGLRWAKKEKRRQDS